MMQEAQTYYVYEWVRPDLNEVYYVGKGKGNRAYEMSRNNHTDTITNYLIENGIPRRVQFAAYFVNEDAAYAFEEERIAFLKPLGFLTNQTDGGDGVRGDCNRGDNNHMRRPEYREQAGENFRAYYQTEDGLQHRGSIKVRMTENNPHHIPEVAEKLSGDNHWTRQEGVVTAFHGDGNPSKKPENIARMIYNNPMQDPEVAEAVAKKNRGRKMPAESVEASASKRRGIKKTAEQNKATGAGVKRVWDNLSDEERKERGAKRKAAHDAKTPEERRAVGKKGWEKRKRRYQYWGA